MTTAGTFGALSSNGLDSYTVRQLADGSFHCQCKGYAARATCCHALAVAATRVCFWCGSITNVETYVNGWDNGAELALCWTYMPLAEVK